MKYIAVLGFGVVGSGTVEILDSNRDAIAKRLGEDVEVKYILDRREFPESRYKDKLTTEFEKILADKDVSAVVEAMGGLEPAYTFTKSALLAGKSVITSNKAVVAAKGYELLKLARENGAYYIFEASVGGGIPALRPMRTCLTSDNITEVAGIVNGTTNFILTKMDKEGSAFDVALKEAQRLGYAEAEPTDDIEGYDAARKIAILASIAFNKHVYPENVFTQGITKLSPTDNIYADAIGAKIKLVARAKMLDNGKIEAMVTPALVNNSSQLSLVEDVYNCVYVNCDYLGDALFYGKGAGKLATASAVVTDVIEALLPEKNHFPFAWEDGDENTVEDVKKYNVKALVRVNTSDETLIHSVFKNAKRVHIENEEKNQSAYIVSDITEGDLADAHTALSEKNIFVLSLIRMVNY